MAVASAGGESARVFARSLLQQARRRRLRYVPWLLLYGAMRPDLWLAREARFCWLLLSSDGLLGTRNALNSGLARCNGVRRRFFVLLTRQFAVARSITRLAVHCAPPRWPQCSEEFALTSLCRPSSSSR